MQVYHITVWAPYKTWFKTVGFIQLLEYAILCTPRALVTKILDPLSFLIAPGQKVARSIHSKRDSVHGLRFFSLHFNYHCLRIYFISKNWQNTNMKIIWFENIVAKRIKICTDQFFIHKISTKNARLTIFPNLRQNSVNAFEIKYLSDPCGPT